MMKTFSVTIFTALFFLCLIEAKAQIADSSATKYSLQQCIATALKNNADVQHSVITSQTQRATWQGSKGYMIPTLNGDVNRTFNQGRSINPYTNTYANQNSSSDNFGANTSITLFNAFAIQNNIKQNRFAFDATKMELQQVKDATALNVILAYLQVLRNGDLVNLANQQSDVSSKQVDRLNILNEDGAISPSDLTDLKGEYAQNQLLAVNAENDLQTAGISLAELMNMPFNKNMQLEQVGVNDNITTDNGNVDLIYQNALKNLAIVKAAELRKRSADYNVKSYRGLLYPSIYANAGLGTYYASNATIQNYVNTTDIQTNQYIVVDGIKNPVYVPQDNFTSQKIQYGNQFKNNFNSYVQVGIRIPIFNNLTARTQLKTAELQQKDYAVTLNYTKNQLQQNVQQSYLNLIAAQDRFNVLTDQVSAYKESFRIAEVKFNAGAITSIDYLKVKNNLDGANINLVIAKYDYVLRSMILDYYSGKLTF